MQIDHLAIWAHDLESLKDFYTRYFGCSSSEKYINEKKQFSSYFLTFSGGSRLEIMKQEGVSGRRQEVTVGLTHFAISLGSKEKVDELTVILGEAGLVVESQPRTTGDGYYESVILDPEGNRVELTI